ncbi:hypothetical protein K402DRAFT_402000 [Aulographum hederae CBS 113979]|uniref:Zn(2)-C6 fungal-type domain-containing protein n=1 Tax=Aulographum hederae CBS 113979 TaxID=1176131 RepID=A0A6G1H8G5_9PEZI|nr:hypothetical protein K402DRAFT_402000 [Aulographum hederae CBS 113979]
MADQAAPQSRPPPTYEAPHSYPSPSMQPTYTYPPPDKQEPYRDSPTGSSMSAPSVNLPPISSIEGQSRAPQQQPPPPPQNSQPVGSPLPPQVAPMSAYYPPPGPPMGHAMHPTSSPHTMGMRYPIPPPGGGGEPRMMSGGRHKKEIKRRTKTGCLTCRKRRIKCDEGHPQCRNCLKSKRDCMGYDPIFKQQSGPAQIQPAVSGSPHSDIGSSSPGTAYPGVPPGYAPATAGYPNHPPPQKFEYGPAIDPALAAEQNSAPKTYYDPTMQPDVKPGTGAHGLPVAQYSPPLPADAHVFKARTVRVEELFHVHGIPPPPAPEQPKQITDEVRSEIELLYTKDYAPGMDKFLETHWYSTFGLAVLFADQHLCEMFAHMIDLFRAVPNQSNNDMMKIRSMEVTVVWYLFCLCRNAPAPHSVPTTNGSGDTNGANPSAPKSQEEIDLLEVQQRLRIFEAILTGTHLETNPILVVPYVNLSQLKHWEVEFWRLVGHFTTLRDDEASSAAEIDHTLNSCRNILAMLENRDVLYSIMIARHVGARMAEDVEAQKDNGTGERKYEAVDEKSNATKLRVARQFLLDESQGKGTTQAVQRVCDMAVQSWEHR